MLKVRAILFTAFFVVSAHTVSYAAIDYPVAISDLNVVENSNVEELSIHFWDALDSTIAIYDQFEEKIYTVEEGDNLFRIALANNVPLESLMAWNNLTSHIIHPGEELVMNGEEITIEQMEPDVQEKIVAAINYSPPSVAVSQGPIESPPAVAESTEMVVTATAYTAYCTGCSGTTAYGIDLRANPNQKVIAVDPRVIPLGTKVWVEGYGEAIAGDTGGAIKGNKIDVFIPSHDNAMAWGVKTVKIRILN